MGTSNGEFGGRESETMLNCCVLVRFRELNICIHDDMKWHCSLLSESVKERSSNGCITAIIKFQNLYPKKNPNIIFVL